LSEVYAAGESAIAGADGRALSGAIRMRGEITPIFVGVLNEMPEIITRLLKDDDILVISGAGDIGTVPALMIKQFSV